MGIGSRGKSYREPSFSLKQTEEGKTVLTIKEMRERTNGRTIPERVGQFYYSLGLFCSSHPIAIIVIAIIVVLISCYPLLNLPLSNNKPQEFTTLFENYSTPPSNGWEGSEFPRWYKGPPAIAIQQIIVKTAVLPWNKDLIITDAFRGSLNEVFHIIELIKDLNFYEHGNDIKKLSDFCLYVGEVKSKALKGKPQMLPEYTCLITSPANFWQEDYALFRDDPDLINTILNFQSHKKGRSGLSEILLGMNIRDTGFKRNPFKSTPRIVTYAITLVFRNYEQDFWQKIKSFLIHHYPFKLSDNEKSATNITQNINPKMEKRIVHIFYPSQTSLYELIPLIITYCAMFVYVYFSVRKVEMITSKLGMAISALSTVVASLCMSVGLCSYVGVYSEINGKAIFPYLVVIIGLENILVLTRSVVSTATHLDVKIRVAQGLSKEGWSITKNILTEVTILTIGFFTFVPMIQEFCILAILGLVSDFFLQTFFFATVLSIDIRRTELSVEANPHHFTPFRTPLHPPRMQRIKSNPRINTQNSQESVSIIAPSLEAVPMLVKVPKRVRLVYFWARTRFFQRTFIVFMAGWISVIVYESGIIGIINYPDVDDVVMNPINTQNLSRGSLQIKDKSLFFQNFNKSMPQERNMGDFGKENESKMEILNNKLLQELYLSNQPKWRRFNPYHWQALLGVYNASLNGKYISVLPPVCISIPVDSRKVFSLRHPQEIEQAKQFNWNLLSNPFDTNDDLDDDSNIPTITPNRKIGKGGLIYYSSHTEDPYIPDSPIELALTVLLIIPTLMFISYTMFVFYKCICSRNYAEWRSSWSKNNSDNLQQEPYQVVFEAVPLIMEGHSQEVECFANDGNIIASVCLAGVLKVWNSSNAENITTVDRKKIYYERLKNKDIIEEDIWQSGSPPNHHYSSGKLHSSSFESPDREKKQFFNNSQSQSNYNIEETNGNGGSGSYKNAFQSHKRTASQPANYPTQPIPISNPILSMRENQSVDTKSNSLEQLCPSSSGTNLSGNFESRLSSPLENKGIDEENLEVPPVWCIDCQENLVVLGTGSGRIEIWDAFNGDLKCTYDDNGGVGVVCIKIVGNRIISAKLNGSIDFIEIESSIKNGEVPESSSLYHRWDSSSDHYTNGFIRPSLFSLDSEIRCVWLTTLKAHQQPITCLDCEGGRILSGSQDHSIKVFRLEDHLPLFTLHGHYGPITCLFIDKISPMTSGSGSQDGMLCVWDLLTGMCMYSIKAHEESEVCSLTYSASYIISVGGDNKICVWERFQGHLLNTIQLDHAYNSSLVMLTHNLLITSRQGSLIVLDVRSGETIRSVRLGHRDSSVFIKQIISIADAILCDYGTQLRLVRFPAIINKID